MIKPTLQKQINEALKAREEVRVSTLKLLSSELHNAEIDNRGELKEEQELTVVGKEVKKRKDAIEAYSAAAATGRVGAEEKANREKEELKILEEFLPQQMSDEELGSLVEQAILEINPLGIQDMGKVVGHIKAKTGAAADGSKIALLVKQKLLV